MRLRPTAHRVGFPLQARVVVHRDARVPSSWPHASLLLLCYVPRLVRQMPRLARGDVDLRSLRVCERVQPRGFRRVVPHAHVVQRRSRQVLDARLQAIRQTRLRRGGSVGDERSLYGRACGLSEAPLHQIILVQARCPLGSPLGGLELQFVLVLELALQQVLLFLELALE